jgi:hypothetical protein
MASRRILILQGHPDRDGAHFCHVLAQRYRVERLGAQGV